jgi:translation initiation factor 5
MPTSIDHYRTKKCSKSTLQSIKKYFSELQAPIVLCELLLDDKVVAQIKKFKRLFLRFTHENQKAQKYLMGGIEKTIESRKEELLPKVNSISNRFCFRK